MKQFREEAQIRIQKSFECKYDWPFILLLCLLVFESFRPDYLIPGGKVFTYLPTALIGFLFIRWLKEKRKIVNNIQTKYLICFFALIVIQIVFARNPYLTYTNAKSFLLYTLPPCLFRIQFIDSHCKVDKYIKLTVLFGLFFSFMGIISGGKVDTPQLGDENDFCLWMNILVPFAYFLGQGAQKTREKAFWYCCVGVFVVGSLVSFSRGGFIGLFAVGLFVFYKSKRRSAAFFLVLMFSILIYFAAPQGYWDGIRSIKSESYEEGTGKIRLETWKAGWKMFLDHSIIGVGAYNFGIWLPNYYPSNPSTMWGRAAHSVYFTLIPEMGIIGTLLFCGMLYGNYKDQKRIYELKKRKWYSDTNSFLTKEEVVKISSEVDRLYILSLGYTGGLIGFLVTGVFISALWYPYFWMITSFYAMTTNAGMEIEKRILCPERRSGNLQPIIRG